MNVSALLKSMMKQSDELIHDLEHEGYFCLGFLKEPDFPRSNEAAMVVHTIVNVIQNVAKRNEESLLQSKSISSAIFYKQ